ncbi:MAG TPA: HupE/UreJ family protein [Methylibium sp.]|nr:HupE/UreJ family protein [Methylibium sp.]
MKSLTRVVAASALALIAGGASAHAGHDTHSLFAGLAHPLAGADHLLAMLAVGMWSAAALPSGRRLLGPALFMLALALAALLGAAGPGGAAWVEPGIAASVALFGLMLAAPRRLPAAAGLGVIAAAALLHGLAHGAEVPAGASFAGYAGGFLVTTAMLHWSGLALGAALLRQRERGARWAWRVAGAAVGLCGLALMASA